LSVADITILLALSVYQLIVSEFLPVSSANVPVIGQSAILHFDVANIHYATIPFSSPYYTNDVLPYEMQYSM